MKWKLIADGERELTEVVSFRVELQKGKPAVLTWSMPMSAVSNFQKIALWRGDICLFQGSVMAYPTQCKDGSLSWISVGVGEGFQSDRRAVLDAEDQKSSLIGTLADIRGGEVGSVVIDPVSHAISWHSVFSQKETLDLTGKYDSESIVIIPLSSNFSGVSASVVRSTKREESGILDVGPCITGELGGAIDTYSGDALSEQFDRLGLRLMRAGYDVQNSELQRLQRQRADIPKHINGSDQRNEMISIPFHSYTAILLCSWSTVVKSHESVTLICGDGGFDVSLGVKDGVVLNELEVIAELRAWVQAYARLKSLNTQVKLKVPIMPNTAVEEFCIGRWVCLQSQHVQGLIQGPITACQWVNNEGVAWIELTLLWAAEGEWVCGDIVHVSSSSEKVQGPKQASDIVSKVRLMNDAVSQHAYAQEHCLDNINEWIDGFPLSQLELEIQPMNMNADEYQESIYRC